MNDCEINYSSEFLEGFADALVQNDL